MASSLGAMTSLVKIFGLLEISEGDRQGLKAQCGITSVEKLIENRENLARSKYKSCYLLVAAVDFIAERRGDQTSSYDYSTVDELFSSSVLLEHSWEHFLARIIQHSKTQPGPAMAAMKSFAEKGKTKKKGDEKKANQKVFRNGDVYWEEISDAKRAADETVDVDDLILAADSPWQVDESSNHVALKEKPDAVRIPMALFKKLFCFQRSGIAWLSGLYINDTGGILGE